MFGSFVNCTPPASVTVAVGAPLSMNVVSHSISPFPTQPIPLTKYSSLPQTVT